MCNGSDTNATSLVSFIAIYFTSNKASKYVLNFIRHDYLYALDLHGMTNLIRLTQRFISPISRIEFKWMAE